MATSSTPYTVLFDTSQLIEKNQDSLLAAPIYRDGNLVEPDSATITVYDASHNEVVSSAATVLSDIAQYTVLASATTNRTPEEGWRIDWVLNLSTGETLRVSIDAVLALRRLRPVITDLDLLRYHPALTRKRPPTETSYQDYLDAVWRDIESKLVASGKRPWLILSPQALRGYHIYLALAAIYRDFATTGNTSYEWDLSEKYESLAANEWATLQLTTASETTGTSDVLAKAAASPSLWAGSTRRGWW